jgi:dihydrofolate reductase
MVSLDGFIAGPQQEIDWVIIDEEVHRFANAQQAEFGAHLYGRRMYEVMQAFWPTADADPANPDYIIEYARIWKAMPKVVFSRTLEKVEGNARLVKTNIAEEVVRLKAQPGKDLALAGAGLAATLIPLGLVDEYELFVNPVVLGSGTPFFPVLEHRIDLSLVRTHPFGNGVVLLRYQRVDKS